MIQFDNLKEKELLIAHYFCEKSRKELSPQEVFDMWSNWFKNDFRVNGKPIFCIENGKLVYRKSANITDKNTLKEYNHSFQNIYRWIKKAEKLSGKVAGETAGYQKAYFKKELDKERRRGFARILTYAKPLKLQVSLGQNDLYKNKLGNYRITKGKNTITSGDCDRVIERLKKMKSE